MQPRLTQVPPRAASSATATRAPRCAAMRAARTPPLPAPMTNRSKAASRLMRSRPRPSSQGLLQQLGDEAVDAVVAAGALLAQRGGELSRQLAGERHEARGGVEAALLASVGNVGGTLAESSRNPRRLHLPADLASEVLVEIGLLHAHGDLS